MSSPSSGFSSPDDHPEQRGLADAVRADHADDAGPGQRERQVVHQRAALETLGQVVGLEHDVAQPRAGRDVDLGGVDLAVAVGLGGQLVVPRQTGLALRLPGLGVGPHPLQLALEHLGALGVLLPLDLQALLLGLEVRRVVALVGVGLAPVQLEDPLRHVVEEVPVVGDRQHAAGVGGEMALQPLHGLRVEVVGRLVEQQQVGLLEQQLAQRHPATLATGQGVDDRVGRRAAQGVHRLVEPAVEVPGRGVVEVGLEVTHLAQQAVVVGVGIGQLLGDLVEAVELPLDLVDRLLDVLQHGRALGQRRLLLEHADGRPGVEDRVAVVGVLEPRHDLEQGRLARAVRPDDADLGAVQERQRDVVEDHLVPVRLAHVAQGEDVLSHDPQAYGAHPGIARSAQTVRRRQRAPEPPRACAARTRWCRG